MNKEPEERTQIRNSNKEPYETQGRPLEPKFQKKLKSGQDDDNKTTRQQNQDLETMTRRLKSLSKTIKEPEAPDACFKGSE